MVASVNDDKLIDRDALCRMADRLAAASDPHIHAVLVVRDADTLHNVKSASKSVASLAVGIAIDRGLIRSVDEPIFSFFPELSDLRSPEFASSPSAISSSQ